MVEVVATAEYIEWFANLSQQEQAAVQHLQELLRRWGVQLPFPHSSAIGGNKRGDKNFYPRILRQCLKIWKRYLAESTGGQT